MRRPGYLFKDGRYFYRPIYRQSRCFWCKEGKHTSCDGWIGYDKAHPCQCRHGEELQESGLESLEGVEYFRESIKQFVEAGGFRVEELDIQPGGKGSIKLKLEVQKVR